MSTKHSPSLGADFPSPTSSSCPSQENEGEPTPGQPNPTPAAAAAPSPPRPLSAKEVVDKFVYLPPPTVHPRAKDAVATLWGKLDVQQREALVPLVTPRSGGGKDEYGNSVFVTGSGGTGKSTWIKAVVPILRTMFDSVAEARGEGPAIAVSALTGVAAWNLTDPTTTARTLHSLFPMRNTFEDACAELERNPDMANNIKSLEVVVVDEVSMFSALGFTILDQVCRKVRGDSRPFGGIRFIFLGDIKQLPPVPNKGADGVVIENSDAFFFKNTELFARAFGTRIFEFCTNYRQGEDRKWGDYLELIGRGLCPHEVVGALKLRRHLSPPDDAIRIYPHNKPVNAYNEHKLATLPGPDIYIKRPSPVLTPWPGVKNAKHALTRLEVCASAMIAEEKIPLSIRLRKGARIVLSSNIRVETGLCNGATFVFHSYDGDVVRAVTVKNAAFLDDRARHILIPPRVFSRTTPLGKASVTMHPIELCWATNIHRTQGLTFDEPGVLHIANTFGPGMVYVALSRFRRLSDIYIASAFEPDMVMVTKDLPGFLGVLSHAASERVREYTKTMARQKSLFDAARAIKEAEDRFKATVAAEVADAEALVALGGFDTDSEEEAEREETRAVAELVELGALDDSEEEEEEEGEGGDELHPDGCACVTCKDEEVALKRAAILADMHRDYDGMVEDGLELADEEEEGEEKEEEEEDDFLPRRRRRHCAPPSPAPSSPACSPPRRRARLAIPSSPDLFDA